MAIDPSIAMGYRGIEIPNQMAQYAQLAQLQAAQNQNALAQYQLGAAQRAEAKDIARTNALAQAGTDDVAIGNALLRAGDLKGYADFLKTRRETQKADVELIDAKLKQSRAFLENVSTPEQYIAWHEANHLDPILGPALKARGITPDQSRARIMSELEKPGGFQNLLNQSKLGTEKFIELNKPHWVDTGGAAMPVSGLTGRPMAGVTAIQKTMTPGTAERLDLERQRVGLEGQRVGLESQRVGLAQEEARLKREGIEGIAPKELQKREAAFPQATSAIKGFESKSESFIKDLEALRDDPGLSQITGAIYGRMPSVSREGSRAQALYDKVVAKGGFQALQDLRDASKTGGALGNVSNQEGKQLTASFAAIDRRQNTEDVKAAINAAISDIQGAKARTREAYDATYAYRAARQTSGATAAPPATSTGFKYLGKEPQ